MSSFLVGAYIRLSREDGDSEKESESITNQRNFLRQYINKLEDATFIDEYVDDGYSGTNFDRPGFQRMLRDIERGKINTVITKDLSRFGREYADTGYYIDKYFPQRGVRYIAVLDYVDTLYEDSNLEIVPFKAVLNDLYAKDISKKVRSALVTLKKEGKYTGGKAPFGYQKDPSDKHHLIIYEEEAMVVRKIFSLALSLKSPRQIADRLREEKIVVPSKRRIACFQKVDRSFYNWSSKTIQAILENPTYMGDLTQGKRKRISYKIKLEKRIDKKDWIRVPATHKGIVDASTFNEVQQLLEKRYRRNLVSTKQSFLLSGLLTCKECGHAIGITKRKNRKQAYLSCTYYRKYSKQKLCTPHTANYFQVEQICYMHLHHLLEQLSGSFLLELIKRKEMLLERKMQRQKEDRFLAKEKKDLEQAIFKKEKMKDQMYLDKLENVIDEASYLRLSAQMQEELHFLYQKRELLLEKCQKDSVLKLPSQNEIAKALFEILFLPNRLFLEHLIEKIEIKEDKTVTIYYKIKQQSVSKS